MPRPRPRSLQTHLHPLVSQFATKVADFIELHSMTRAKHAVLAALGDARWPAAAEQRKVPRGPKGVKLKQRKKLPLQLCPVLGCKNAAAPVYGMVCADHRVLAASVRELT